MKFVLHVPSAHVMQRELYAATFLLHVAISYLYLPQPVRVHGHVHVMYPPVSAQCVPWRSTTLRVYRVSTAQR
jgi:hypothetical protein